MKCLVTKPICLGPLLSIVNKTLGQDMEVCLRSSLKPEKHSFREIDLGPFSSCSTLNVNHPIHFCHLYHQTCADYFWIYILNCSDELWNNHLAGYSPTIHRTSLMHGLLVRFFSRPLWTVYNRKRTIVINVCRSSVKEARDLPPCLKLVNYRILWGYL